MALVSSGLGWGRQWVQPARGFWGESSRIWLQLASRAGPRGLSVTTPCFSASPPVLAASWLQAGPELFPPGKARNPKDARLP